MKTVLSNLMIIFYLNNIEYKEDSIEVKMIKRQAECSKNTQKKKKK